MIEILNRQKAARVERGRFERLLRRLLRHYGLGRAELSLSFVENAEIRGLNRRFRGKNKATDVLSFPFNEQAADGRFYLGDIVISVPVARVQAARLGHALRRELEILAVHGFLHLLGYDHDAGHEIEEAVLHGRYLRD